MPIMYPLIKEDISDRIVGRIWTTITDAYAGRDQDEVI